MKLERASEFDVHIVHTLNGGYIVHVGCAQFAYGTTHALLKDLKEYLSDPQKYEKKYRELRPSGSSEVYREPLPAGGARLGRGPAPEAVSETPPPDDASENKQQEIETTTHSRDVGGM